MTAICRCERSASDEGFRTRYVARVIVATEESELPQLEKLFQRGLENHISVIRLSREQVQEYEPHVSCLAGIHVSSTGITNYGAVCQAIVDDLRRSGADLRVRTELLRSTFSPDGHVLETTSGEFSARFLITCAGLYSDRVSIRCGSNPEVRIVPFRGEYYELKAERKHLVKDLIYPVANPNFPFLGGAFHAHGSTAAYMLAQTLFSH